MGSETIQKLQKILAQLDAEIRDARPGSDHNQMALFDLFYSLRNGSARDPIFKPIHELAKSLVDWAMSIVESGQPYKEEQVQKLRQSMMEIQRLFQAATGVPESASAVAAPASSSGPTPSASPSASASPNVLPEEKPVVMDVTADGDILRQFVEEANERLDEIEQGILDLEKEPTNREALDKVFRAFHNLKGGSGFLNLVPIHQAAHELESLLELARSHELRLDKGMIELILQGADILKHFIAEIQVQLNGKKPVAPILIPTEALKANLRAAMSRRGEAAASAPEPEKASAPVTPAPEPKAKPPAASKPSAPAPAAVAVATPSPAPKSSAPADAVQPKAAAMPPPKKTEPAVVPEPAKAGLPKVPGLSNSVKVDTQKLDALVDLVGELVIAQSFVAQHPDLKAITNQFFTRSMAQLNRITKELQRTAMSMRMIPVGSTFQKMMRVVRDLATKQGKQVSLVLDGEDTELDRTIVEEIGDPLMHMIRNSIDHGIEPADVRAARGKPAEGKIALRAFHQGGNVVIQIQDDGNGLNRERILQKAIEKGLISADDKLPDAEVYQLIFAPGFSTAEVVTDISGRGVGMDVVRKNIEKLQGKVEIESEPGQGTTFSIYLPLTLAIIEALVVSIGDQRYIIPALSVRESFQLSPQMLSTVYNRGEMVKVRDRLIPLLRLHEYFNIQPQSTDPTQGIVIVLEAGRDTRCLLVDRLLHKQEVVIKSLNATLKRNPALAGAAILGDGRVGLILDVNVLVQLKSALPMAA